MQDNYNTKRSASKLSIRAQLVKDEKFFPKTVAAFNNLELKRKKTHDRAIQQLGYLFTRFRSHQVRSKLVVEGKVEYAESPLVIGVLMSIDTLIHKFNQLSQANNSAFGSPFRRAIAAHVFAGQLLGADRSKYKSYKEVRAIVSAIHDEVVPLLIELGLLGFTEAHAKVHCRIYDTRPLVSYLGRWIQEEIKRERKAKLLDAGIMPLMEYEAHDRSKPARLDSEIVNSKFRRDPALITCVKRIHQSTFRFNTERFIRQGLPEIREYALFNYGGVALYNEMEQLEQELEVEKGQQRIQEIHARLKEIDKDLEYMDERVYACERSMLYALDDMDLDTPEPQYFSQWHLQGPGRIHTDGGAVWLPKLIRWLYIQPSNPEKIALELDLKSCQLLIACQILRDADLDEKDSDKPLQKGCEELLQKVKAIAKRGDSVWKEITPDGLEVPKRALKVLVYSLVFGCPLGKGMQMLVNAQLRADGHHFQFSQAQIKEVLGGFLEPLVISREKWMAKYSLTNILNSTPKQLPDRVKNAAGHVFHLRQEATEYLEQFELDKAQWADDKAAGRRVQPWEPTVNESEIAGRALAHLCQGAEAHVMQSFIASDAMQENVLAFQFDGMTVECHPNDVKEVMARYSKWLQEFDDNQTFEYLPLWFARLWTFTFAERGYTYHRSALDMLENDFERINKDPRRHTYYPKRTFYNSDGDVVHPSTINWLLRYA
ncbi:hypothetical protein IQ273_30895 [Nodosilinea sp. LEGE 07298]|uniref:hypothetical protein n=1 Tax=Nodosilinea sp. LEGE 07298 TaxID=2777970 RepID=UPI00187FEF5B|nr:hypothetical protein [Nodosilinea sp. LEGE 07298]MBE9113781.1 hypothetical protein [Nodosilinea sp. LEGE 07298]